MALGEEKAEVEASTDIMCPSCGRQNCREQSVDISGPVSGEQPPCLEAEGGPASSVWGTEGLPAPACYTSGACEPQASNISREPIAGASHPALGCLLPPGVGTGDLLHSVGSQVGTQANRTIGLPNAALWDCCVPAFCHHLMCFLSHYTRWDTGGSWV